MSLERQIKEARGALEELTTDEAELSRLEADKAAAISKMRAEGSKDFAALAELEAQRAALASMLGEQRGAMRDAEAEISRLEAERQRRKDIDALAAQVSGLTERRSEVDKLTAQLERTLQEQLAVIIQARAAWDAELSQVREDVRQMFDLPPLGYIGNSATVENNRVRQA